MSAKISETCSVNNGGCSNFATCDMGGSVPCNCLAGFSGDGITCNGTVLYEFLIYTRYRLYVIPLETNCTAVLLTAMFSTGLQLPLRHV